MVIKGKPVRKILVGMLGLGLVLPSLFGSTSFAAEPKTVVYWSMFNKGEPLQVVVQEMITKFESANPDIKIEANWVGRDVLTKVQAAIQAGTPVDIVDQSNDRLITSLVNNKLSVDLTKYLAQPAYGKTTGTWAGDFVKGAIKSHSNSSGTYMIPRETYISGIWYNSNMIAKSGIKISSTGTTWDQFTKNLATIAKKNPGVSPLGADGSVDFYNNWWFSYLALRNAGLKAWQDAANDPTGAKWNDPAFLKAANQVRQLQDAGYFQKNFQGSVYPAMQMQWANSKVAMLLMGAWLPKEAGPTLPSGFKMDVFAFPTVPGGKGNDLVEYWSNAWSVVNIGKQTDSAVKFLKFTTSLPNGGSMMTKAGFPVPLTGAVLPPEYKGQAEILAKYTTIEQRGGMQGMATYSSDVYNLCDDPFFLMKTTPKEFIKCLVTQNKKYWAANK